MTETKTPYNTEQLDADLAAALRPWQALRAERDRYREALREIDRLITAYGRAVAFPAARIAREALAQGGER